MKKLSILCLTLTALSLAGCGGVKAASALTGKKVSGTNLAKVSDTSGAVSGTGTFGAVKVSDTTGTVSSTGTLGAVSDTGVYGAAKVSDTAASPAIFNLDAGNNSRTFISGTKTNAGLVEIKEKMFIAQVNDVYLNPDDYVGKTIRLQGLFMTQDNGSSMPPYHFVIRYGPGCCGNDGNAGFEVLWENKGVTYPQDEEWVEAVGTFGAYEEDGYPYYCISLSSLKVLDERGAEYVSQ